MPADRETTEAGERPRQFRKKPVVVEAVRWDGDVMTVEPLFSKSTQEIVEQSLSDPALEIPTLEGTMRAEIGDWIILGIQGELYPCKPDIFAATYEPVDTPAPLEPPAGMAEALTRANRVIDEVVAERDNLRAALASLRAELEVLRDALEPFARADRGIGDEPGPFRFETGSGHRLIEREDLRRARTLISAQKEPRNG